MISDLYQNGLAEDSYCFWGFEETPEPYFLICLKSSLCKGTVRNSCSRFRIDIYKYESTWMRELKIENQSFHKSVCKYILANETF